MVLWSEFVRAEPEFARRVRALLDGHEVKVLATVRADGRAVLTGPLTGEVLGDGFRADVSEVVWTGVNDAADRLVVESWRRPERGRRRVERE